MIRRQVHLPAPPERVWSELTQPDALAGWFGGRFEWDVEEGRGLAYVAEDGAVRSGLVTVVRPGRYLRFHWQEDGGPASEVSYLLEPAADGGTELTVQEREVAPSGPECSVAGFSAVAVTGSQADRWTAGDAALLRAWAWAAPVTVG